MKLLLLFTLGLSQAAFAQGLTDILFKRTADFEERQSVSKALQEQGKNQPLEVQDAIAELCYGIDLCAQLTPDSELANCEADDEGECYSKTFREKYNCSETVKKQNISNVAVARNMISDMNSLYNSLIQDPMLKAFSSIYNVDFKKLAKDPRAMKEFMTKNPKIMEHIQTTMMESLGMGAYTMDCYSRMNPILYTQDKKLQLRYFNFFKSVINTMVMFPEHKEMVNRGTNLPASILKEHHKIGNVVCYPGFTSTAVHNPETDFGSNPSNTFLSGKCTQRMYISYSDSAVGGKFISSGSAFKSEDEVLFEPGACFRIDKVYPRTDAPGEDEEEDDVECQEGERFNFEMTLVR